MFILYYANLITLYGCAREISITQLVLSLYSWQDMYYKPWFQWKPKRSLQLGCEFVVVTYYLIKGKYIVHHCKPVTPLLL